MKKILKIIGVALVLIPFVRKLIEQVEIPGFGPEKRKAVLDALRGIVKGLPWNIEDDVAESAVNILGSLIDITVAILNLLGHDWGSSEGATE